MMKKIITKQLSIQDLIDLCLFTDYSQQNKKLKNPVKTSQ